MDISNIEQMVKNGEISESERLRMVSELTEQIAALKNQTERMEAAYYRLCNIEDKIAFHKTELSILKKLKMIARKEASLTMANS